MQLTPVMSEKKSTKSSKKSGLLLNLESGSSFWEFYLKNRMALDSIIDSQIRSYSGTCEVPEVRQEIILRMNRCNILSRFNKEKSAINTFITGTVSCYVQTYFHNKKKTNHNIWNPWPTQEEYNDEKTYRYSQKYVKSLNNVEDKNDNVSFDEDLSSDSDDQYFIQETIEAVRKILPKNALETLNMFLTGHSLKEISQKLDTQSHIVSMRVKSIKQTFKDVIYS